MKRQDKRDILFAVFIACMVIVNTIGIKIISLFSLRVSVGIFFMPVLFLITDIVGEVYGEKEAQKFVNISSVLLVFLFAATAAAIAIKPHKDWNFQEEYRTIFFFSSRMILASVISFITSQKLDVHLFSKIRKATGGKHLWIRNNVATIISQFIDTTLFEFIAFWHINEKYTLTYLFSLIIPYWLCKVLFALLDTPFCYLGVRWLKGREETEAEK